MELGGCVVGIVLLHTFLGKNTDEVYCQVQRVCVDQPNPFFPKYRLRLLNQPFQEIYMLKVIIYDTDPQLEGRDPQLGLFGSSLDVLCSCCLLHL